MNVVTSNKNKDIIDRLNVDVIKRVDGEFELKELLTKFVNLYFNKMILDITSIKNYEDEKVISSLAKVIDPSRVILLLSDNPKLSSPEYISFLVKTGFYNFTRNYEGLDYLIRNPNTFEDVQNLIINEGKGPAVVKSVGSNPNRKIIGFANLTQHAGATTLVSMCTRQMNSHGFTSVGIEMFRQDMSYYRDPNLLFCTSKQDLEQKLKVYDGVDAIFIDINDFSEASAYCDKILYLVEPSFIKLTKLLKKNKNSFIEIKGEPVVLNMSFIKESEVKDFEFEFKTKIFANIPSLDDHNKDLYEINNLLGKLGFSIEF